MNAWCGVITLFPEMFNALNYGIPKRAKDQKIINIELFNPRDFTKDKQRTVDDRPFGGGPGMLLMYQPLKDTIKAAKKASPKPAKVIYLSPSGKRFDHKAAENMAKQLSGEQAFIFLAGRYEGIDQRLIDQEVDETWSVGDYVTSGGELPCMILLDSIIRLMPGALGHEQSAKQDAFVAGLLDCPHYTRPEVVDDLSAPKVLLSGDHNAIANWRRKQALGQTWLNRPDLLKKVVLASNDIKLLDEFKREYQGAHNDEHHKPNH